MYKTFLYLLLLMLFLSTYSQDEKSLALFDKLTNSKSLEVYTGELIQPKHSEVKKSHIYYKNYDFLLGSVTYKNQVYTNVLLKYNLFDDELYINYINTSKNRTIHLDENLITSFDLAGKKFLRLDKLDFPFSSYKNGFFEVYYIDENNGIYIKRHKIKELEETYYNTYYRAVSSDKIYIKNKSLYTPITRRKSLLHLFPNYKDLILRSFSKRETISEEGLKQLLLKISKKR